MNSEKYIECLESIPFKKQRRFVIAFTSAFPDDGSLISYAIKHQCASLESYIYRHCNYSDGISFLESCRRYTPQYVGEFFERHNVTDLYLIQKYTSENIKFNTFEYIEFLIKNQCYVSLGCNKHIIDKNKFIYIINDLGYIDDPYMSFVSDIVDFIVDYDIYDYEKYLTPKLTTHTSSYIACNSIRKASDQLLRTVLSYVDDDVFISSFLRMVRTDSITLYKSSNMKGRFHLILDRLKTKIPVHSKNGKMAEDDYKMILKTLEEYVRLDLKHKMKAIENEFKKN